jgi:hypothetical protein
VIRLGLVSFTNKQIDATAPSFGISLQLPNESGEGSNVNAPSPSRKTAIKAAAH